MLARWGRVWGAAARVWAGQPLKGAGRERGRREPVGGGRPPNALSSSWAPGKGRRSVAPGCEDPSGRASRPRGDERQRPGPIELPSETGPGCPGFRGSPGGSPGGSLRNGRESGPRMRGPAPPGSCGLQGCTDCIGVVPRPPGIKSGTSPPYRVLRLPTPTVVGGRSYHPGFGL